MFGSRDDVLSILTHVILELLQGGVTVGVDMEDCEALGEWGASPHHQQ